MALFNIFLSKSHVVCVAQFITKVRFCESCHGSGIKETCWLDTSDHLSQMHNGPSVVAIIRDHSILGLVEVSTFHVLTKYFRCNNNGNFIISNILRNPDGIPCIMCPIAVIDFMIMLRCRQSFDIVNSGGDRC